MGLVTALEAVTKLDKDLYVVEFPDGTEVIFRLPSFKQAQQFAQLLSVAQENTALLDIVYNHIFQEFVVDKYLAFHDPNLKAGIPSTVAQVILYLSGVDDNFKEYTEMLLDTYRSYTQNIFSMMRRSICVVFPAYKMSDLDDMTFQELIKVYVEAETVLLERGIIEEGLKFAEPEKKKPFTIESILSKDMEDYNRFENDNNAPRLTEDPSYRARQEEFRVMQNIRRNRGG